MNHEIILTDDNLLKGVEFLCQMDADLANIFQKLGAPPLWKREPGFPTLVYIILEQQVSLASAKAAFQKLNHSVKILTPQTFIDLSDSQLKEIGFSRQKSGYCRGLATAILDGKFNLESMHTMDDNAVRLALMNLNGIGRWTADIYLLMALLRPDIWPVGDLALLTGIQEIKKLPSRPTQAEMEQIAEPWRPWRAIAARLVWLDYLNRRNSARNSA